MQTAYITHPACRLHDMGLLHPESPARLGAMEDRLIASGLWHYLRHEEAPPATDEQLLRVHAREYVAAIRAASPREGFVQLDPDTVMNPHTLEAALRAAGAVILATELVLEKQVENAFCAVRPPGHHAESARAMGFCIFNNVAVGAAHAMAKYGLTRIAIADFDVHHGNGTEEIFRNNARVMLCSSFQHPFYPHVGAESSNNHIINVPLPAYSGGEVFRAAVSERWLPALERFRPEMLFISAGFDAHREDDMAQLNLLEADYTWVTEQLKDIAVRHAQGRIVSALEGGYDLDALGRSVQTHIKVLSGL
ncbi:MAG: histone deacetylase family protein [Methylobacillus sp.]|nr:histone deacetylase family protein [Methylobacillus sp.]